MLEECSNEEPGYILKKNRLRCIGMPILNDARETCLLRAALYIQNNLEQIYSKASQDANPGCCCSDLLISMSDRLMKNMTTVCKGSECANKYKDRYHYKLWTTQPTALAKYQDVYGRVQLTTHRLLSISDREDPLELFSLLIQDCGLQPSEIVLRPKQLAESVRLRFPDEGRYKEFISVFKNFLQKIVILGLPGLHGRQNDVQDNH